MLGGEVGLGALLVGVGPVENLLLDELAGSERLERRAREIEIGERRDRQKQVLILSEHVKLVVHLVEHARIFALSIVLGDCSILSLDQFLGGVAPGVAIIIHPRVGEGKKM